MRGERSSWLTSDANRASRSMRSCRAWAMSLNEAEIGRRSGSSLVSSRVSRRPAASAMAAVDTPVSGRRARRLAHQPSAAPASVVTSDAPSSEIPRASSVSSRSASDTISK